MANFLTRRKSQRKPFPEIEIGFPSTLPNLMTLLAIREDKKYA